MVGGLLASAAPVGCGESATGPVATEFPDIPAADLSRVPEDTRALYAEDAAQLVLREITMEGAPAAASEVEFPVVMVEGVFNALLHVYNLRHQARDSVATLFRIHVFPATSTHEVVVEVNTRVGWVDAWLRGERLTGNAEIDDLVTRFDLHLTKVFSPAPAATFVVLFSERPLNTLALADRFLGIDGVEAAAPNQFAGAGNDIRIQVQATSVRLTYSVGFGDCPSGCISRHNWHFDVHSDGTTRYRGTSGDPLVELSLPATVRLVR